MEQLEIYLLLFTDSFVSNFVFNNADEVVLHSMKIFNTKSPYLVIITATSAAFFAYIVNYALGIACYKILAPMSPEESRVDQNVKFKFFYNDFILIPLLLLSAIPFFGKFIILFSGFCRASLRKTLLIGTLSKLTYYIITYLIL